MCVDLQLILTRAVFRLRIFIVESDPSDFAIFDG